MTAPVDLKELTLAELESLVQTWDQPRFRARQILKWVYKGIADFGDMTDLSRAFREELRHLARLSSLTLADRQVSQDGTQKFRWLLEDGLSIESVLILEEDHSTLCLSSQVGCALGCRFCLTARQGLARNLSAAEIVNQVLAVRPWVPRGNLGPPGQAPYQPGVHGHGGAFGQFSCPGPGAPDPGSFLGT